METTLDHLRNELEALTRRVSALEERGAPSAPEAPAQDEDAFWALNGLRARLPRHPATLNGSIMLVGAARLPSGAPVEWQQEVGSEGLLEADWSDRASVFAALGQPVRIELLRHVLAGIQTTADLAAIESLGTTGQLHHHLRQLLAAGWLRQSGRGVYEVPAGRIVPLLACVVGAER